MDVQKSRPDIGTSVRFNIEGSMGTGQESTAIFFINGFGNHPEQLLPKSYIADDYSDLISTEP